MQQQASVIEIASLSNAEESVRQGRAIMVFTVVTVVFVRSIVSLAVTLTQLLIGLVKLPLSFMSSLFGMNNSDFGGNTMSLRDQFRFICECTQQHSYPLIV